MTATMRGASTGLRIVPPQLLAVRRPQRMIERSLTVHRHTWMIYLAGLARDLDYPDLLTIAAPTPTLVQSSREDELFTLAEMERAHAMIALVYAVIGAPESHRGSFYPGPHKFDLDMQAEAFAWLDRWLRQDLAGRDRLPV